MEKAQRLTLMQAAALHGFPNSRAAINNWSRRSAVPALCPEGCKVEPDGECPHGHPSALLHSGLV